MKTIRFQVSGSSKALAAENGAYAMSRYIQHDNIASIAPIGEYNSCFVSAA